MPTEAEVPKPWPARIVALVFVLAACYSGYLAVRLLTAHCEGFSCTYLGMAWLFWVGVLCVPTTVVGYFVRRAKSLPLCVSRVLQIVWWSHTTFSVGLLLWWLAHRF